MENVCEHLGKRSGTTEHDLRGAVGKPAGEEADSVWMQASCRQLLRKHRSTYSIEGATDIRPEESNGQASFEKQKSGAHINCKNIFVTPAFGIGVLVGTIPASLFQPW